MALEYSTYKKFIHNNPYSIGFTNTQKQFISDTLSGINNSYYLRPQCQTQTQRVQRLATMPSMLGMGCGDTLQPPYTCPEAYVSLMR